MHGFPRDGHVGVGIECKAVEWSQMVPQQIQRQLSISTCGDQLMVPLGEEFSLTSPNDFRGEGVPQSKPSLQPTVGCVDFGPLHSHRPQSGHNAH